MGNPYYNPKKTKRKSTPKPQSKPTPQPYVTPTRAEHRGAQQASQRNRQRQQSKPPAYPGVPRPPQQAAQPAQQPYVTPTQAEWSGAQQATQNAQRRQAGQAVQTPTGNMPYPGANLPAYQQQQQQGGGGQFPEGQPYVTPTQAEWAGAQQAAAANIARQPQPVPFSQTFEGQRIAQGQQPYMTSGEMFPFELLGGGEGGPRGADAQDYNSSRSNNTMGEADGGAGGDQSTRRRVEVLKSNRQGDPNANKYDFGSDGAASSSTGDPPKFTKRIDKSTPL